MKKIITSIGLILTVLLINMSVFAIDVTYTPMSVPNINSSWKTWMQYNIARKGSPQRNLIDNYAWIDGAGFARINGERDLGITDDYYCVAMGAFYGRTIGNKYRITTNTGHVFYVIMAEFKDKSETNSTQQYGARNKDILEFLVNTSTLYYPVKNYGTCNVYMPLNGSIISIEKINFIN